MRRTAFAVGIVALALLVSGCFQVQQHIDLSDGQSAVIRTVLRIEQAYSGAEMDIFINALHQAVPAIERTSDFSRGEESRSGGTWVVYEWDGHERQPLEDMPFSLTARPDGSYSFEWTIEPIENFSDQTESDSIVLVVSVALPAEVDIANTMHVTGNVARWELRKVDLANGVRLRALTN